MPEFNPKIVPLRHKIRHRRLKISGFELLALPYVTVLLFLIFLPVLMIALYAFIKDSGSTNLIIFGFDNFIRFIGTPENIVTLGRSLRLALIATVICFLLGYPYAYFTAGSSNKSQRILILLATAPMWINMLLRVYAWRQIFDTSGSLNAILGIFGVPEIDFLATEIPAIIGMVSVYLPFMILPIYTVLRKLDSSLIEASSDLGARPQQTFWRVIFPLSIPGILSGITMVLLPTATTLVIPEYLSKNNYALIGNLIEMKFKNNGDWGYGSAISIVLGIVIMALVFFANRFDRFAEVEEKGAKR